MKHTIQPLNHLESEGTDTESQGNAMRNKFIKTKTLLSLFIVSLFFNANAVELHLFSQSDNGIVGIVTSGSDEPFAIEGFIDNNFLEAVQIQKSSIVSTDDPIKDDSINRDWMANSDGTGRNGPANSDGTGGAGPANSDGTGTPEPEEEMANSDGTGKVLSVLMACDNELEQHVGLVESSQSNTTVVIDHVYLDGELYTCS
jgi:hypothetical protein